MGVGDYVLGAIGIIFYITIGYVIVMLSTKIVSIIESFAIGIAAGVALKYFFELHTVFCILLGFAAMVLFLMLMSNYIGFWLVVLPLALLWGGLWGIVTYESSDWIWGVTVFLIMSGTTIWIHMRGYEDIIDYGTFDISYHLPRRKITAKKETQYSESTNDNSQNEQSSNSHESYQNTETYQSSQTEDDYYEILGLKKGATQEEIKAAYRKLSKKYHPDVNDAANASVVFRLINEAYNALVTK